MATFPLQKHPVDEMYGEAKVSVPSTLEIMVTVIIYLTGGRFSGERIIHCEREREREMTILTRVFITREGRASRASRVNHAGDGINLANCDAA